MTRNAHYLINMSEDSYSFFFLSTLNCGLTCSANGTSLSTQIEQSYYKSGVDNVSKCV